MTEQNIINKIKELSDEEKSLLMLKVKNEVSPDVIPTPASEHKKLVAYVKENEVDNIDNLKNYLKTQLPDYMIPNIYAIDDFPLLPNGKIDKTKLKSKSTSQPLTTTRSDKNNSPVNKIEEQLIEIWEEVLGFSPIHINDNFFEIGGDSILSIQIVAKLKKLGFNIKANELFEFQTIKELSEIIVHKNRKPKKWDFVTTIRKEGTKNPLFCIHSGGGHVFFYGLLKDYLKKDRPIYAIEPLGLNNREKMHKDVQSMSKTYLKAIKDIQPRGPYNVLVNCFSTAVGNELCILMEQSGDHLNLIVADTMASAWNATDAESLKVRRQYFIKRLIKEPLTTIKLFLQDRKYIIEPYLVRLFGRDFEKDLERIKANLRKLSIDYVWKVHNGFVSLILTEKIDERFQNHIIKSWKNLAKGGVKTYITKGHHNTLFLKPDVAFLSEQIDEAIIDN